MIARREYDKRKKQAMQRLDRILSEAGVASRKELRAIIRAGRVCVNGTSVRSESEKFDEQTAEITLDGQPVVKRYTVLLMLYKPAGYVTSSDDPSGPTVMELIPDNYRRLGVMPVGRLDKATEGLLLFTNDGALANALTHPSHQVAKMYRVTVHPAATEEQVVALANGVVLDDGTKTLPAIIRVVAEDEDRTVMEMSIKEGKNRQIRRMCRAVGLDVARLSRKSVGAVKLGMLAPGKYRELKPSEILALKAAAEKAGRKNAKKPVKDR